MDTTGHTTHRFIHGDARDLSMIQDESVHLVVTSPPYWTLKEYRSNPNQLGHVSDYETFLAALDAAWRECFRVLVPGGRLVCVVGDVCLSRRRHGRHVVVPLHADICVICRRIGFDNLNPIIWHKISNAHYEVNNGTKFLGKPYEPNAIIKNDIEFILMQRKPGGYRQPTASQREQSKLAKHEYDEWFRQFWTVPGASTKNHPAPFPLELAYRLVRMFSFTGDTVLDPFLGTGTTSIAAMKCGRNSIGVEIDKTYLAMARRRAEKEAHTLFSSMDLLYEDALAGARECASEVDGTGFPHPTGKIGSAELEGVGEDRPQRGNVGRCDPAGLGDLGRGAPRLLPLVLEPPQPPGQRQAAVGLLPAPQLPADLDLQPDLFIDLSRQRRPRVLARLDPPAGEAPIPPGLDPVGPADHEPAPVALDDRHHALAPIHTRNRSIVVHAHRFYHTPGRRRNPPCDARLPSVASAVRASLVMSRAGARLAAPGRGG